MTKQLLTETVTFRLSKSEFKPYRKIIQEHGGNKSKLFRDIFIDKSDRIELPVIQSKESKRIVFLANKSANNLNQIARKINESHKAGVINDALYIEVLNKLNSIENLFKSAVHNVS